MHRLRCSILVTFFAFAFALTTVNRSAHAQNNFEQDRKAILSMAGAFSVKFDFNEVLPLEKGYEMHAAHHSKATEWVTVVEDSGSRIILQHILQVSGMAVKHWTQEWVYQNRTLLEFKGNNRWATRTLPEAEAAGTWTQRVFQTDDSPRYEGFGRWMHTANLVAWESNPTWRPLPRREHTERDDYQVIVGRNRHTLSPTGWVHEQDNYKLVLDEKGEPKTILCREVGFNTYDRTDEASVALAKSYWESRAAFWSKVRGAWAERFAQGGTLELREDVDGKPLQKYLDDIAKKLDPKSTDDATIQKEIRGAMTKFIVEPKGS